MIIVVNFPIEAIAKKKPEKNQGFNGIRTSDLFFRYFTEVTGSDPVGAPSFSGLFFQT